MFTDLPTFRDIPELPPRSHRQASAMRSYFASFSVLNIALDRRLKKGYTKVAFFVAPMLELGDRHD